MAEQTVAAASSAEETPDVFNGASPSLAEYMRYRNDGEVPERFKPAETEAAAAPAEPSEGEQPESVPEAEPEEQQEKPQHKKPTAEERIAQLEATIEKIRRGAGIKRETEVAPVAQTQPAAQPTQYTRPKPTVEAKNEDGTSKYGTYEDYVEDLADWKAEQRIVAERREQSQRQQAQELQSKIDEARTRYGDAFDDAVKPALQAINGDQRIPVAVKAMLGESENVSDLLFTLGSDPKALESFIETARTKPGQALRHIAILEAEIRQELQRPAKPAQESPAKTQTAAPKPPSPVGGASSRAFDVSDESLSPDEWARKRNADLARRKRG